MLATARDDNGLCVCIDAVLNQLGYGFEGIALRERDNADRVPIVADSQFAPLCSLGRHASHLRPELPEMNHPLYRKPSFLRYATACLPIAKSPCDFSSIRRYPLLGMRRCGRPGPCKRPRAPEHACLPTFSLWKSEALPDARATARSTSGLPPSGCLAADWKVHLEWRRHPKPR